MDFLLRLRNQIRIIQFIVCMGSTIMKSALKRKNYYLDERKIRRARAILGARTETEAVDAALDLVVFRRQILKSLEKVAGKGGGEKIFWWPSI